MADRDFLQSFAGVYPGCVEQRARAQPARLPGQRLRVLARMRPLVSRELARPAADFSIDREQRTVSVQGIDFRLDRMFPQTSSQQQVCLEPQKKERKKKKRKEKKKR